MRDLDCLPTPGFASQQSVKTEGTSLSSSGQGIRPRAPEGGNYNSRHAPGAPGAPPSRQFHAAPSSSFKTKEFERWKGLGSIGGH